MQFSTATAIFLLSSILGASALPTSGNFDISARSESTSQLDSRDQISDYIAKREPTDHIDNALKSATFKLKKQQDQEAEAKRKEAEKKKKAEEKKKADRQFAAMKLSGNHRPAGKRDPEYMSSKL